MEEGICKIFMRRVSLNTFWYCMARVGWLDGRITIHSGGGTLSSLVLKSVGISTFWKYLKNIFHNKLFDRRI